MRSGLVTPRTPPNSSLRAHSPSLTKNSSDKGRGDESKSPSASSDFLETARGPRIPDPSNIRYLGNRVNGLKHGEGVQLWTDGRRYIGQFEDGQFHGNGTMSWPDGRTYRGQYSEGYKHGAGIFCWNDGRMYSGEWFGGKRNGKGLYVNAKGESGMGVWADDRPCTWSASSMPATRKRSTSSAARSSEAATRLSSSGSSCSRSSDCSPSRSSTTASHETETPSSKSLPTLLNAGPGRVNAERFLKKVNPSYEDEVRDEGSPTSPFEPTRTPMKLITPGTLRSRKESINHLPMTPEVTEETVERPAARGLGAKVAAGVSRTEPPHGHNIDIGVTAWKINFFSLLEFWQGRDRNAHGRHASASSRPSPRVCKPAFGPSSPGVRSPRQPSGDQSPE